MVTKKDIEKKLLQISRAPEWESIRMLLEEEIKRICDYDKVDSMEKFIGFRTARKIWKEVVRKIDGAEDALTFLKDDSGTKGRT